MDRELALTKVYKQVFPDTPQILCKRHIAMDVDKYIMDLTKTTKYSKGVSQRWNSLVASITEEEKLHQKRTKWLGAF